MGLRLITKIIPCIVYFINCAWCSCFVTLACHRGWWAFLSFHASACASSHLSLCHHVVALFILKDVCLSIQNDNTALTLLTFQLLAWKVMGWCTVSWSRLLFKMAMLGQFLCVPRNFETSMIAWDQVWAIVTHIRKCEQITSWPEIWWHDAMYHVLLCQCSHFFLSASRGCCRSLSILLHMDWMIQDISFRITSLGHDCPSASGETLKDHYSDVIMGMMVFQITSLTIVFSTVYSAVHQGKHQSSASLAFVWGIHQWLVNSLHKWLV